VEAIKKRQVIHNTDKQGCVHTCIGQPCHAHGVVKRVLVVCIRNCRGQKDFRWLPQNVIVPALLSVAGTIKACTYGVKDRSQNQQVGCKKEEENAV